MFDIFLNKIHKIKLSFIFFTFIKAGVNFDPKTSKEDIIRLLGSKGVQGAKAASPNKFKTHDVAYENLRDRIPKNFDARKKWRNCLTIGEVRDQGKCGSCWVNKK